MTSLLALVLYGIAALMLGRWSRGRLSASLAATVDRSAWACQAFERRMEARTNRQKQPHHTTGGTR